MHRLVREPLIHFLAVGVLLFLVSEQFAGADETTIVVTEAQRARLADQWQARQGRPPDRAEMRALVDQWLREEILYREALAMGLDADDIIIRRRLAQKLTFLGEDLGTDEPLGEEEVRAYFERHADRYATPERFSFRQVFFSRDRRADARADAAEALAATAAEGPPDGDTSMFRQQYIEVPPGRIAEEFGDDFTEGLASIEIGAGWQGPVASVYGWHLVRLDARRPSRPPVLEEVAVQVRADLREERRREAREAWYRSLRERYQVVRR